MKKSNIILIILALLTLSGASFFGEVTTESVYFKYFIHYPFKQLKSGKYYTFMHNDHKYKGLAVKKLVCMQGQIVTRTNDDLYCDGKFMVKVTHVKDSNGNDLSVYNGGKLVDEVMMLGEHPSSYDSRYFGGVSIKNIKREVFPLW